MRYAIFSNEGKQYKVAEGEELLMDHLATLGASTSKLDAGTEEKAKTYEFKDVLLVVDGEKVILGEPTIKGAKVSVEILGDEKGDKIRVVKYKSKSRYRTTNGFRHQYTRVKISKIAL